MEERVFHNGFRRHPEAKCFRSPACHPRVDLQCPAREHAPIHISKAATMRRSSAHLLTRALRALRPEVAQQQTRAVSTVRSLTAIMIQCQSSLYCADHCPQMSGTNARVRLRPGHRTSETSVVLRGSLVSFLCILRSV